MSMLNTPSLLRLEEHRALREVTLHGEVLDLGGDKHSEYLSFFCGEFTATSVNIDQTTNPDITHDLEKPLPFPDRSYDGAVLFNVIEHIFEYRSLLRESVRVLRPKGTLVVAVPFLFPIHPSPEDFHRFTASALDRELRALPVRDIVIRPLGGGVFSARYTLLDRLLPRPVRFLLFYTVRYVVYALDHLMQASAKALHKRYSPGDYALGYVLTATKT